MDGEIGRFIIAAAAIYGGIRLDLVWMRRELADHGKRITKLEEKHHGNTQAQG